MAEYTETVTYTPTLRPSGAVEIRRATQMLKNGEAFGAPQNHRIVISPGDDISDLPNDLQASINAWWTEERCAAWDAKVAAILEDIV